MLALKNSLSGWAVDHCTTSSILFKNLSTGDLLVFSDDKNDAIITNLMFSHFGKIIVFNLHIFCLLYFLKYIFRL